MRKYIFALILGCGIVLQYQSAYAQVEDDNANEIEITEQKMCGTNCTYELDNKGFLLIKPNDPSKEAHIQEDAFKERKDFTRAKIEEGILSIGKYAFQETNLVKIDLPNSITSIGRGAFANAKLKKIKVPDSVSSIEVFAFARNELREVILPKNLKVIESGAFYDNDELVDIVIPDTVTSIESPSRYELSPSGAFESCDKMENIHLSDSLESIGEYAFSWTNIKELNLPKSLKRIGRKAFSEAKIPELIIPDSVIFIDEGAFGYTHLSYLIIPDTTEVSDKAFEGATIGIVYCRGDIETCKDNLKDAVPETTVFKPISELKTISDTE